MSIIKKKKHVSKKNKKAWRKHCDIRDVEDFLEDQRLEERLGKFESKEDGELFVIDTEGTGEKENNVVEATEPKVSAKQRKRAQLPAVPRCYEVLLPTSKVQDPNGKRNHVNPFGFRPTALSKISEQRKINSKVYENKILTSRKDRVAARVSKRKKKENKHNFDVDMWGEGLPQIKSMPETLKEEFISTEAQLHNFLPDRRIRPVPPQAPTLKANPAVNVPHPGASYNPAYKEHQDLLQQVCSHEKVMMKKEAHLHRMTTRMFSRVTQQEREVQWKTEMSTGLPNAEENKKAEAEEDTDNEYKAVNPPVKNKKKDHKARRKQRERLVELEKLKRKKIDKKKITDIYKLRKLQSSIVKTESRQKESQGKRQEKKVNKALTVAPALSAHKVPKVEPLLVDPRSLTGDLRNVSSSTNLLRDRYESFQRRGALAGAKLMMKKKKRVKPYFKAGHKVTEQDVERYLAASKKK